MRERSELVDKGHPKVSMRKQCKLLAVARSSVDYQPVEESKEDLEFKRILDEIYLADPCLGSRRLVTILERDYDRKVNRKRLCRLRREMGQEAIWCQPRTSIPDDTHRKYPYLLRNLKIERSDHVWCADITYVPMAHGHAYLCAVMDWHSRKVLGWELSRALPESVGESPDQHRARARDLQHRPGLPVHLRGMDRATNEAWGTDQYGWPWSLDGQRVHRTTVAEREI
jgi:putative transposase